MKNFLKVKNWLISITIIVTAVIISAVFVFYEYRDDFGIAQAGSGDNVTGFAWSENIGWISFNTIDCDTNENDAYDAGDTGPAGCPAVGTLFFNYGVNIDSGTGNFSRFAWSSNVGWISFAPTADLVTYPGCGFPEAPCNAAHYNNVSGQVTGWAKILTLDDDGWLKMNGTWTDGVSIDSAVTPNEFHGWAWNDDTDVGIGWVSFNCAEGGPNGENICGSSDYKVIYDNSAANNVPTAINLSAPNWNFANACSNWAKQAFLRWEYSDSDDVPAGTDPQSAYQVIFDDDSDPADPIIDTGKTISGATQYSVGSGDLNYNTAYYWWVKVWDSSDAESDWAQYNTEPDTDNDDGNVLTFTTYKHEFPNPYFNWLPENPSAGESAVFTDASKFYFTAAPSTPEYCSDYWGTGACGWQWTNPTGVTPGTATINPTDASSTIIILNSTDLTTIKLEVTDADSYTCSTSTVMNANVPLPTWKEVKP